MLNKTGAVLVLKAAIEQEARFSAAQVARHAAPMAAVDITLASIAADNDDLMNNIPTDM